jgi:hypothetical protein
MSPELKPASESSTARLSCRLRDAASRSLSPLRVGTLAAASGMWFVGRPGNVCGCCLDRGEPPILVAGMPGAGAPLTPLSSSILWDEPGAPRPKSRTVLSATRSPTNGTCRRSPNGCDRRPINGGRRSTIEQKTFSTLSSVDSSRNLLAQAPSWLAALRAEVKGNARF